MLSIVSIGMPVHNGMDLIKEALESLLAQTYGDFELIIGDNASTDGTEELCRAYSQVDHRIRYGRNSRNLGVGENFNEVLRRASGVYFMWAAHDDLWEPDYVSALAGQLARSSCALAFAGVDNIDLEGRSIRTFERLTEIPSQETGGRLRNYLEQEENEGKANLIYGLMRRETIVRAGGFRRWGLGGWGADMLTVFKILTYGDLSLADGILFHKRLPAGHPDYSPRRGRVRLPSLNSLGRAVAKIGYLIGYVRILSTLEEISPLERMELTRSVVRKAAALSRSWIQRQTIEGRQ